RNRFKSRFADEEEHKERQKGHEGQHHEAEHESEYKKHRCLILASDGSFRGWRVTVIVLVIRFAGSDLDVIEEIRAAPAGAPRADERARNASEWGLRPVRTDIHSASEWSASAY